MRSKAPIALPIFRSEHQAQLLSRLFGSDTELPMSTVAGELGIPLTTLHREAERLEEAGLLASRRVGRTRLLRANRDHPAARPLADLLLAAFGAAKADDGPAPPARRDLYRLRPGWRPRYQPDVYVPRDLDLLAGPTSGRLDPPVKLYWQPGELDFGERADLELFYSAALSSASASEDFAEWIDRNTLCALWDRLSLPARVRRAWQTVHPQLREGQPTDMNDRIRIQDTTLAAIAEYGFALAGGSALIDYDVVGRETDDIDAFNDRWDAGAFTAACQRIVDVCHENGWAAEIVADQDMDKKIQVNAGTGHPVVVQLIYYGRSRSPEPRAGGGLRLVFDDVVAGKGAAVADAARGRDFSDLAHIVETPGWSLEGVERAMRQMRFGDLIEGFRTNVERFRRGEFDDDISKSGLDPDFCHRVLGEANALDV